MSPPAAFGGEKGDPPRSARVDEALLRVIQDYLAGGVHVDHFAERFDNILFASAPGAFRSSDHQRLFTAISEQIAFVVPDDTPEVHAALLTEAQFKEWLRGALRKERARAEFDARLADVVSRLGELQVTRGMADHHVRFQLQGIPMINAPVGASSTPEELQEWLAELQSMRELCLGQGRLLQQLDAKFEQSARESLLHQIDKRIAEAGRWLYQQTQ